MYVCTLHKCRYPKKPEEGAVISCYNCSLSSPIYNSKTWKQCSKRKMLNPKLEYPEHKLYAPRQ